MKIEDLPRIELASAGWDHSLVVSEDGEIWAWGGNQYGQLGVRTALDGLLGGLVLMIGRGKTEREVF